MATKHLKIRCAFCNKKIPKNRPWQKFCSNKCRMDSQKSGSLPAVAIERLVKKFVLRWTDVIIDREMKKARAKLREEIQLELDQHEEAIRSLQLETGTGANPISHYAPKTQFGAG